jgi:murein DD-endopeptidase MepM/ murein hydrolase activator NlpD
MAKLFKVLTLFSLLWGLTSCQPIRAVELSTDVVSSSTPEENLQATLPANVHTVTPTSLPKNTIEQPVPSIVMTDLPTPSPVSKLVEFSMCSPLQHENIASLYEIISDPYNPPPPGRDERHHGVDFSYYHHGDRDTIEGEGVQAILAGSVAAVINDRLPYGNMVIIETAASLFPADLVSTFGIEKDESLYHLYAHMQSTPLVKVGEAVECGQALGTVGMTGYNVVNPHLHLETRIGPAGESFRGMAFYTTSATIEEMENYQRWRTSGEFRHFDPISLFTWFLEH